MHRYWYLPGLTLAVNSETPPPETTLPPASSLPEASLSAMSCPVDDAFLLSTLSDPASAAARVEA